MDKTTNPISLKKENLQHLKVRPEDESELLYELDHATGGSLDHVTGGAVLYPAFHQYDGPPPFGYITR